MSVDVAERPILFSGPMVRAILDGRKTQTRRVIKPMGKRQALWLTPKLLRRVERFVHRCDGWWGISVGVRRWINHCGIEIDGGHIGSIRCPFRVGITLWVRETWCDSPDGVIYRATAEDAGIVGPGDEFRWRPSIYMPRWASRITLRVTDVRVQRVQEISDDDAIAEGVDRTNTSIVGYARTRFKGLWNSINAKRGFGWDANPWVWVVSFE